MLQDTTAAAPDPPITLAGTFNALVEKLAGWVEAFVLHLPNLIVAVLIVVAAALLARVARRLVRAALMRVTTHAAHGQNVVGLLATLAYVAVLAAGVFMALGVLALSGVVTSLLAGAGIIGLALGFAFQDIASNFIAGVLMAVRSPFVVGQLIETNGFKGTVTDINLRSTVILTLQGERVILPNAKVFQEPIVNFSSSGRRRVDLEVGVGYGDDLEQAERLAREALEALPMRDTDRPVEVFYTGFGDSSIDLVLQVWIPFARQPDFLAAQSAAVKAVKRAFDEGGVTIPFPIRTLDFGPSGGVAVREAMAGPNGRDAAGA
ncbi:MAG: mechanosensitive ion channel family protein [Rubricoccaceae bacterium]